jgi:DNA-binding response OmpR family regulator
MTKMILIVARDIETRDKLTLMLSNEKYYLKVSVDFESTLKLVWAWPPDAIILDMETCGMDAFNFLAKARSINPNVCVIGISDIEVDKEKHGLNYLLRRPLSRPHVLSVLTRCLAA